MGSVDPGWGKEDVCHLLSVGHRHQPFSLMIKSAIFPGVTDNSAMRAESCDALTRLRGTITTIRQNMVNTLLHALRVQHPVSHLTIPSF